MDSYYRHDNTDGFSDDELKKMNDDLKSQLRWREDRDDDPIGYDEAIKCHNDEMARRPEKEKFEFEPLKFEPLTFTCPHGADEQTCPDGWLVHFGAHMRHPAGRGWTNRSEDDLVPLE